jgi:hypothetical protein
MDGSKAKAEELIEAAKTDWLLLAKKPSTNCDR